MSVLFGAKFANHGFYINGYVAVSMHQGMKVLRVALFFSWNVRTSSLVSTAAYSWWSSAYVVRFLTEEMGSLNLIGNCQWTSTILRITKKQCVKILKECCGSNFSFPLSATNRAGWSIGPICHHRHLIHDTFKRQIPNDFTNHYTDNEPAVSQ